MIVYRSVHHVGKRLFTVSPNRCNNRTKRFKTSSKINSNNAKQQQEEAAHQQSLNWKDRKEAPKWLKRLEPSKGGTKLPTPLEGLVISIVAVAGYYAWFVDPPRQQQQSDGQE